MCIASSHFKVVTNIAHAEHVLSKYIFNKLYSPVTVHLVVTLRESGLVCESVGKAKFLSAHFDGEQSRDPEICHPRANSQWIL